MNIVSSIVILTVFCCMLVGAGNEFGNHFEPTTKAPTTHSPTTKAPTTKVPTTKAPTTKAPTTHAPTTHAPTTHAPTTRAPTESAPIGGHPIGDIDIGISVSIGGSGGEHPIGGSPIGGGSGNGGSSHEGHGGTGGNPFPFPQFPDDWYTPYEKKNINVTKTLYEGLISPHALEIVEAGVYPPGIFSANASGRITPVGSFTDAIGSFEYFYGLASHFIFIETTIVTLIAKANLVALRVDLTIDMTASGVGFGLLNLTQEGFITFDEDNLITSYDLVILRLGEAFDPMITPEAEVETIYEICEVEAEFCTGANQQYPSLDACIAYISAITYGTWDNASSNTTVCRELHSLLVPLRPDYHCPHIGPTGGGACVDTPYDEFYQQNF